MIVVLLYLALNAIGQQPSPRTVTDFDANWKFKLGDPAGAHQISFIDKDWRVLNLPHDWSIEGENNQNEPGAGNVGYFPSGKGWYRKAFDVQGFSNNRLYSIEFDGVYMNSEVWLNGVYLGKRPYGYASFSYNLLPHLKARGNILAVRVDNSIQPNSRYYTGSGISRHVRLIETNKVHFEKWGVISYTKNVNVGKAFLHVEASVLNENNEGICKAFIKNEIYDSKLNLAGIGESTIAINGKQSARCDQEILVESPELWSVETPNLYTLISYLYIDGKMTDLMSTTIGIRTIEYDVDKGFILNGMRVKMKGVNLHHDAGAMGAAVPERVWERRLEILKEGGCNAIRTAHNVFAPEFYDLCDKVGMLVMDEAFDEWLEGKRDNSYKLHFAKWYEQDLKTMVLRDRNHPSVVMWSIGNEVPDQSSKEGPELAEKMIMICRAADPTRLITSGNDRIVADDTPATAEFLAKFNDEIVGYNYPDRWRERRELLFIIDRHEFPGRRMVTTESGGMGGPRGAYNITRGGGVRFPASPSNILTSRFIDTEQRWKFTLLNDYVIGDFMWTGIDYYGETSWPSRGATSGYLDNCGFKKDGFYFFKSIWTQEPTLHILPNWNLEGKEGQVIQVVCFTNCTEVELFVNGKSYGKKTLEFPRTGNIENWRTYAPTKVMTSTADLHLAWDVVYEPGEVIAVGKTRAGEELKTRIITAGKPNKIRLTVDRDIIRALPSDVAHITVGILDADDNLVPLADNLVKFTVEGAKLIGVESGNMADLSSAKASERKAYGGMCLAILQAEKPAIIKFMATSEGLKDCVVEIKAIR